MTHRTTGRVRKLPFISQTSGNKLTLYFVASDDDFHFWLQIEDAAILLFKKSNKRGLNHKSLKNTNILTSMINQRQNSTQDSLNSVNKWRKKFTNLNLETEDMKK